MHVIGVRHARNTGRQSAQLIRADGDRFASRGSWQRVTTRGGWRRVATGNHFFLDAVAGAVLAWLTWAVVSRVGRRRVEQGPHPGDQDGDADDLADALTRNLGACLQTSCSGSAARTG